MTVATSKYVLLDRDGVINHRVLKGYVTSWSQFVFLPRALEALRLLALNNVTTIVVSNQACVGKGLMTSSELDDLTRHFLLRVEEHGGRIHKVYYCPHRVEDDCECRKPKPGLLLQAQKEHQFDFAATFLVGDSETDLLAAKNVECPAILISSRRPSDLDGFTYPPQAVFSDLYGAAQYILGRRECSD